MVCRFAFWILVGFLLGASPARGQNPRVYLAWHAPAGMPGATDTLSAPCGSDSTQRDTLYLSFDPGRDSKLFGAGVMLYFRAQPGDTLGPSWWWGGGESNRWNVRIEYPVDSMSFSCKSPWPVNGMAGTVFDRTSGRGRLRVDYAVSADLAGEVKKGTRYCFARLLIPRPRRSLEHCDQPICVEWRDEEFAFGIGEDTDVRADGGDRWVAYNSPGGRVCATYRSALTAKPWDPRPRAQPPKKR